ncbi:hypothetical protein ACF0HT_14230 (plasmid) [Staphylococcus xylosus]|uniref:hypothetical protein n=1 Tax=Staphylococcus xylosus TaxID=1288 RepID=UPI003749EABD
MEQTTTYTLLSKTREENPKIICMGAFDDKDKIYKFIEDCGWDLNLCSTVMGDIDEVVETDDLDYIIIENKVNEIHEILIHEFDEEDESPYNMKSFEELSKYL